MQSKNLPKAKIKKPGKISNNSGGSKGRCTKKTRVHLSTLHLQKVRTEAARKLFRFQGPSCYYEILIDIRRLTSLERTFLEQISHLHRFLVTSFLLYILIQY